MSQPEANIPKSPFADSREPKPSEGAATKNVPHEAGVPRRFGMGILLVITTMYAVLFAVLQALHVPPGSFVVIAVFFTIVGLGQMLLFKGRRPRRASVLVGACTSPGIAFVSILVSDPADIGRLFPAMLCPLILEGAVLGYIAGLLIAGVFLFIDKIKRIRDKRRRKDPEAVP